MVVAFLGALLRLAAAAAAAALLRFQGKPRKQIINRFVFPAFRGDCRYSRDVDLIVETYLTHGFDRTPLVLADGRNLESLRKTASYMPGSHHGRREWALQLSAHVDVLPAGGGGSGSGGAAHLDSKIKIRSVRFF